MYSPSRRVFLQTTAAASTAWGLSLHSSAFAAEEAPIKISLAEWSFHKAIFGKQMDHLDFAKVAKREFGIDGVEYVNQFWKDKARDESYLKEMKQRAEGEGVKSLLIMIDGEGALGDADDAKRKQAVENHHQWAEAAKFLGCHSIRVNAQSSGSYDEQLKRAADGLRQLSEFAAKLDLNVIVENHGGLSSNGKWLASVIQTVGLDNCGTLPDFGNFGDYDRYQGVKELMPFAKAVSAKSHDFDENGNETRTDYFKIMEIVLDAGYRGYVGIEYEGSKLSEAEGVLATKKLLERVLEKHAKG
jgi:sugar phosphate isomerase/epimerase